MRKKKTQQLQSLPELPIGVAKARKLGTLHYLSKTVCPRCNNCYLRYTSSARCVACCPEISSENYKKYKKRYNKKMQEWREKHPDYHKKYNAEHKAESYLACLKHANKSRMDPNWGPKDDAALLKLIKDRNRLIEETGVKWRLVRVGSPIFRVANLVLVRQQDLSYKDKQK